MNYSLRFYSVVFLIVLTVSGISQASDNKLLIGYRQGIHAVNGSPDFWQYEVFGSRQLFSPVRLSSNLTMDMKADGSLALFRGCDESAYLVHMGPSWWVNFWQDRVFFLVGSGATYLSKYEYQCINFGSHIQFITHAGIGVRLDDRFALWYRFQHMSNASIAKPNPGVNLHAISLGIYL